MEKLFRGHVQVDKEYPLLSPKLLRALDTYIGAHNGSNSYSVIPDNNEVNDVAFFQARFYKRHEDSLQGEWLKLISAFECLSFKLIAETCDSLRRSVDTK